MVHIWFLLCTMSFSLFSFSRLRFSTSWYRGYGILSGLRPFPPRLLIIWSSNFLFFFPSSDDETRHSDGGIHSSYLIVCKLYLPNSCTSLIVCLKSTPSFSIFFFLSSSLAFFAFVTWPWERRRRRRRKLKVRKKEELVFAGVWRSIYRSHSSIIIIITFAVFRLSPPLGLIQAPRWFVEHDHLGVSSPCRGARGHFQHRLKGCGPRRPPASCYGVIMKAVVQRVTAASVTITGEDSNGVHQYGVRNH